MTQITYMSMISVMARLSRDSTCCVMQVAGRAHDFFKALRCLRFGLEGGFCTKPSESTLNCSEVSETVSRKNGAASKLRRHSSNSSLLFGIDIIQRDDFLSIPDPTPGNSESIILPNRFAALLLFRIFGQNALVYKRYRKLTLHRDE